MRLALRVHTQSVSLSSSASRHVSLRVWIEARRRQVASALISLFACAHLFMSGVTYAGPADPDREIPTHLEKVTYRELKITASSVARGFSTKNLKRMKAWRAWGSEPHDVEGAWVHFEWPRAHYLGLIHYVPGDERAPGFFDKKCSRPAQVELRGDHDSRVVTLEDVRGHQYIKLDPPLVTRKLKMTVRRVRGRSEMGGVCFAAISFYMHHDPMRSIEGLRLELDRALEMMRSSLKRERALESLSRVGPAVVPFVFDELKRAPQEQQRALLQVVPELFSSADLALIREISREIHPENHALYTRTRAALGDRAATAELLSRLDELKPSERALILGSVARARDESRLGFLLSHYGAHPEVDELLRDQLPHYRGAYAEVLKLYERSRGQARASLLELLARVDVKRASDLLLGALRQQRDPLLRSGAIRGVAYSDDPLFRDLTRRSSESVYVVERRAVAFALSRWSDAQDTDRLKQLANDKSMSVRQEALMGLGRLGTADGLLRSFALYGSDESTATTAATAWLSGEARLTIDAPLKLLSSPFERVRAEALRALTAHRGAACSPIVSEILRVEPVYDEHVSMLGQLWRECARTFTALSLKGTPAAQVRALMIVKRLMADLMGSQGARGDAHDREEVSDLVAQLAASDEPKVQVAAAEASGVLSVERAERAFEGHLKSRYITTQCAALIALSQKQSTLTIPVIEEHISRGIENPYRADRALLICALQAAGYHRSGRFAPSLKRAYLAWVKSLGFVSYRKRALESLIALPQSPDRLEALMRASTDLDHGIRELALKGLRR